MGIKYFLVKKCMGLLKNVYGDAVDDSKVLLGTIALDTKRKLWNTKDFPFIPKNWNDYGFKVFSQGNEDGLIQYLINQVEIKNKTFIEFGVEDYSECNTKFLLLHDGWSGLVMDGSFKSMNDLKRRKLYLMRHFDSKGVFITKENINGLISDWCNGEDDLGILSIDIDGVDYWILEAIECIKPRILICEYNALFGSYETVSVPYRNDFYRGNAHFSNIFYGASLGAFAYLAKKKGYHLVCTSILGNNAFFIRDDIPSTLPEVSVSEAYKKALFREAKDNHGKLIFPSDEKARAMIGDMEVIDVISSQMKKVKNLKIL